MKNYSLFKSDNIDLRDSKIIDIFISDGSKRNPFEGGLTIVFEKDFVRGFVIIGYTELGEWIEYCQIGKKIIHDFENFIYNEDAFSDELEFVQEVIKDYNVA